VYSASSRSRATATSSAMPGMPRRPRRVETAPSCMWPARLRRGFLGVGDQGEAEILSILERPTHDLRVGDRRTVVGDGDGTGVTQLAQRGEDLAFACGGDRAGREHAAEPLLLAALEHEGDELTVVDGRLRVGHRHDGGKASGGGGPRARGDVFLVLLARLAEMDVQVDEARHHPAAAGVDHLGVTGCYRAGGADAADAALFDQKVGTLVKALRGSRTRPF